MANEEKKLQRMEYLGECLKKFLNTEPKLTLQELAIVLSEEIEDIKEFLKVYTKQQKKR